MGMPGSRRRLLTEYAGANVKTAAMVKRGGSGCGD
jgi:hypothetical protein